MSVLGPSIAAHIKGSKSLYKLFKPLADRYASMAGYRQHGLKYDDLLIEENPVVQKVSFSSLWGSDLIHEYNLCTAYASKSRKTFETRSTRSKGKDIRFQDARALLRG